MRAALTSAHLKLERSRRLLTTGARDETPSVKRAMGGAVLGGLVGVATMLCGRQVNRYNWKLQLIEERRIILQREPRPLRELVPDVSLGIDTAFEFTRVVCEGVFDHPSQVLLGPRSAPVGMSVAKAPAGAPTQSGWEVLTPMALPDGSRVLVNRGWVARDATDAILQPTGTQRVEGVLKEGEKENRWATNDIASGRYMWLDLPTVAAATDSQPVLVVAAIAPGFVGDVRSFPHARPVENFMVFHVEPSRHMSYAATWGSLAVAGTFMTRHFLKRH